MLFHLEFLDLFLWFVVFGLVLDQLTEAGDIGEGLLVVAGVDGNWVSSDKSRVV